MTGLVRFESSASVATVTIDRPKALNALNAEVLQDFDAALDRAFDEQPRCLIITGAGDRAFVAGADVRAMSTMTRREALEFSQLAHRVFRRLETLPIPSIAAVNGFALGGGCELAMAADIRIASTRAVFGQPEVGLGITPGFGGTQRLARLVGLGVAKEMLFSARRITAARALEIGLVNEVVEPDALLTAARELATEIAAQGPIAVRQTKEALQLGMEIDLGTALKLEAEMFASCFETADQREAMSAFAEKRPAQPFRGV